MGAERSAADQCVCVLWQMALTVRSRQRGVTELLHEPGPHVGARGESPLPDLHLFLEPKVILGWSQMFGLSLFRAQPEQFEYLWDRTQAPHEDTGLSFFPFRQKISVLCVHRQQGLIVAFLWREATNETVNKPQTPDSTADFKLHRLVRATPALHLQTGLHISAQDGDGKCRGQLHGDIHTILKRHTSVSCCI